MSKQTMNPSFDESNKTTKEHKHIGFSLFAFVLLQIIARFTAPKAKPEASPSGPLHQD